jgi:hypothetical protein
MNPYKGSIAVNTICRVVAVFSPAIPERFTTKYGIINSLNVEQIKKI